MIPDSERSNSRIVDISVVLISFNFAHKVKSIVLGHINCSTLAKRDGTEEDKWPRVAGDVVQKFFVTFEFPRRLYHV